MRPVSDRALLLGAAAGVVVPVVSAWSYRAEEMLLWSPALVTIVGIVAIVPSGHRRGLTTVIAAAGCATFSAVATLAILVTVGPLDVRSVSAGLATLVEALGLVVLVAVGVRVGSARRGLVVAGLGTLATGMLNLRFEGPATSYERLMGTLVWGAAALAAAAGGRHLREQDQRRARALQEAKRTQRLLLARDLHDFVAHDLSAALAQAQAGQFLGSDDDRVMRTFRSIEDSAQRALRSMDRTLRMLRELEGDPSGAERPAVAPPDLSELAALVERFRASGGWQVRLEVDPALEAADPAWLPAEVSTTLYRVAVEALTNVRRHARGATAVGVLVRRSAGSVELSVTDDGRRTTRSSQGRERGGSGLRALADRLEALGGTLRAGPEGARGWSVRAAVPIDAPEPRP